VKCGCQMSSSGFGLNLLLPAVVAVFRRGAV
jgi:hypothetical protein